MVDWIALPSNYSAMRNARRRVYVFVYKVSLIFFFIRGQIALKHFYIILNLQFLKVHTKSKEYKIGKKVSRHYLQSSLYT